VQPGWYPDPWGQAPLRWWDGFTWTGHITGGIPVGTPGAYIPIAPAEDLATERRWATRGWWAFAMNGAFAAFNGAVFGPIAGRDVRHWWDNCRTSLDSGGSCSSLGGSHVWVIQLVSIPGWILQIFAILWLYNVATIAQRLRLPARRSPGWAFGYFVPVVNFWFPYQVARDCVPADHPGRRQVRQWWALFLISSVGSIVALVVAMISGVTPGVVIGGCSAAVAVGAAAAGCRMVRVIEETHQQLLTGLVRSA
jgi:hypothetical protein